MSDYAQLEQRLRAREALYRDIASEHGGDKAAMYREVAGEFREAADALLTLSTVRQQLYAEASHWKSTAQDLQRELEEAKEALAPFAREAADWDAKHWGDDLVPFLDPSGHCGECGEKDTALEVARFTVGDLRRAAALVTRLSRATDGQEDTPA